MHRFFFYSVDDFLFGCWKTEYFLKYSVAQPNIRNRIFFQKKGKTDNPKTEYFLEKIEKPNKNQPNIF